MKYALIGGTVLDGTEHMQPRENTCVLIEDGIITGVIPLEEANLTGYETVNLCGKYVMPGLINMHVHLAGNGKPQKKQRDNAKLVKKIMSTGFTRALAYKLVCSFAKTALLSGVTTIRTVGGLADFDTKLRDEIALGKKTGPRILAANQGISVPGGHMAGSVAVAVRSPGEARTATDKLAEQKVDLIKLMITGGVLDAKQKGVPGEVKMSADIVKAACEEAHSKGYKVAAHVESPEGVRLALLGGVDSIEHGAKPDDEIINLFHKNNAFLCTTISPALPYAFFDRSVSHASEVEQYNGQVVFDGIVECAKAAIANDIPVVLGNDVGCPYVTQYDFWRELCYFTKYVGVDNAFALHTATLKSAVAAGIGDVTGSIETGKCADIIVTTENPLDDIRALSHVDTVIARGRIYRSPKVKINKKVERELDKFL